MGAERRLKHLKIIFFTLLVAVMIVILMDYDKSRTVSGIDLSRIPMSIDGWQGIDMPKSVNDQKRADAGNLVIRRYTLKDNALYLVAIQERGDRHRVHSPLNCYTGSGWSLLDKREVLLSPGSRVRRLLVKKGNDYRLVYYWFTNGTSQSTGFLEHLLLYARDTMLGKNNAAWVYFDVSSDISGSIEDTGALMSAFVAGLDYPKLFEKAHGKAGGDG